MFAPLFSLQIHQNGKRMDTKIRNVMGSFGTLVKMWLLVQT